MSECSCNIALPPRLLRGVTRTVRVTVVDKNDNPVDLTVARNVVVTVALDGAGRSEAYVPGITVGGDGGNVVEFAWYADVQKRCGRYTIDINADFGNHNQSRVDFHRELGVELVEHSNEVTGMPQEAMEVDDDLDLEGTLEVTTDGMSAFDQWRTSPESEGYPPTEEGFFAWMRQPATDAASAAETQMGNIQSRADEDHRVAGADHTQAGEDHTRAESDHTRAGNDHTTAAIDHTIAGNDHTRAGEDHTIASADHVTAGNDHTTAQGDHTTAASDHTLAASDHGTAATDHSNAASDHSRAATDHTTAAADHTQAGNDHTAASADHTRAEQDHTTAGSDHTRAGEDHTQAGNDHTRAEADHGIAADDHTQATADHAVMAGYDTRLGNVEDEVSQLGQEIYNYGTPTIIQETQSVASGSRFDKTLDLSDYVGRPMTFKVTKTGGSSTGYMVYNDTYNIGSAFQYGQIYGFIVNEKMATSRFMGMAVEGENGTFVIDISIGVAYGLENAEKKMFVSKTTDYSGQVITGKYINTNNAVLPTNPTTLANCGCVSGTIRGGDILRVKGSGTSKNVALYAFYDGSKNKIMSSAAASTNGQNALEIIAPSGSAYFAFNSYTYDSTNDSVAVKEIFIIEEEIDKLKIESANNTERIGDLEQLSWKGKTVVCFGDSITEFADSHLKSYPDYLAEFTGATVINVGVGGTRLACRTTPVPNPDTAPKGYAALDCANLIDAAASQDFTTVDAGALYVKTYEGDDNLTIIARLKAVDWREVDAVTFFIGTNDWGGSQNYGTSGEVSKVTTLGAINYIITTLLTAYPHLKIYWFTPCVRWIANSLAERTDANWGGTAERSGRTLEQFAEGIISEVTKNNIPVCDMYHTLGWNKANFSQYFYDTDGTHPTKGFPEIARKFAAFINSNRTF